LPCGAQPLAFLVSACAFAGSGVPAAAQNDSFAMPYDVYDRSVIDPRSEMQPIDAVVTTTQSARRIYEHAFFTPTANFQQSGYACSPVVSVSFSGRTKHLHRGTYCSR
jgi:hypothetical protein